MKLNYKHNKSKFVIPKSKNQLVERTDVFNILDKAVNAKLTIISAPAGSGKTTTAASWLEARTMQYKACWITLDERDDNMEAFWSCIVSAAEIMEPSLSCGEDNTVDSLLNCISVVDQDIIFILDNFHFITNKDVLNGIKHFLDGMAENIHVIIISRTKPNINLARLRLNGEVTEITKKELDFSQAETLRFFEINGDMEISTRNARLLRERTEGWAAGLQIALLSLKKSDLAELEDRFNGENEYIQDYFTEEVINGQTDEIKDFLLKTCVLDELNPELCNAVSLRKNSQQILEEVYDLNLFLDRTDRDTYRYHRLFREFLLYRLNGMDKEEACEAGNRAARWYEKEQRINDAVNQYIKVGNYKPVIDIVEAECFKKIMANDYLHVISWLDKIPQDIILGNAIFCLAYMYINLYDDVSNNRYNEFAQLAMENSLDDKYKSQCVGILSIIQGDKWLIKCQYRKSLQYYENASNYLESDPFWNIIINVKSAVACFFLKDGVLEKKYFDRATALSQTYQDDVLFLVVNRTLIFTKLLRGKLNECENICNICINPNIGEKLKKTSLISIFYIVLSLVLYEKNELDKAEEYVIKGLKIIEDEKKYYFHFYTMYTAYYVYAGILFDKGDKGELDRLYEKFEELEHKDKNNKFSDRYFFHLLKDYFEILKMGRYIGTGRVSQVEKLMAKRDLKLSEELIIFSQLLLFKDKSQDALMILNKLLTSRIEAPNPALSLRAFISRAQIFSQEDQYENATRDLKEALILGCNNGFIRSFFFKNAKMGKILLKTIKGMKFNKDYYKMGDYLNKVLSLYSSDEHVELISKREKEVLQLIENGAKNSEIAKKLFITESTAKSHILNIFSKLGVHNRVQAIAKAKEIGIL